MPSPKVKTPSSFRGLPACEWCMFLEVNRLWGICTTWEPDPVSSPLVAAMTAGRWAGFHYAKCFVTGYGAIRQRLGRRLQCQGELPFLSWNPGSEGSALLRQDMSFLLFSFGLIFLPFSRQKTCSFPIPAYWIIHQKRSTGIFFSARELIIQQFLFGLDL